MSDNCVNKKSKRKFKIGTAILLIFVFLFAFVTGFLVRQLTFSKEARKFNEIVKLINDYAIVLDEEVTADDLAKSTVESLLKDDKYAKYYTKEEYKITQEENDGNYSGFGFSFYLGTTKIFSVTDNSPAEINGFRKNDVITAVKIKGTKTEVNNFNELNLALRDVALGEEVEFEFTKEDLTSDAIILNKTDYKAGYVKYLDNKKELKVRTDENGDFFLKEFSQNKNVDLNDKTAVITLKEFNGDASEQLNLALNEFYEQNKTDLILDLRDNGGGSLDILIDVCEQLLPSSVQKNSVIMRAELKNGEKVFKLGKKGQGDGIKNLIVLANGNTASASEALIGALSHYKAGGFSLSNLVVEYNDSRNNYSTYGKGIMQTTYKLSTGGALKITTAKIYWPDGQTTIHETGAVPSLVDNGVLKGNALNRAIEILG